MNREVNTIGSKANDPLISRLVVAMKSELEKFASRCKTSNNGRAIPTGFAGALRPVGCGENHRGPSPVGGQLQPPALWSPAPPRAPREGEVDGQDYHFVTEDDFLTQIRAGGFLEHAEVYGNRYGTLKSSVQEALAAGRDVLIVNDVQGALTLSAMARRTTPWVRRCRRCSSWCPMFPNCARAWRNGLRMRRNTIEDRLAIAEAEMQQQGQFDHVIVSSTREADFERAQTIYQNAKAACGRTENHHSRCHRLHRRA